MHGYCEAVEGVSCGTVNPHLPRCADGRSSNVTLGDGAGLEDLSSRSNI